MKYAMDVKVSLKPVFSSLIHSGYWEGPCRVGPEETSLPEYERKTAKEQLGMPNLLTQAGMTFDHDVLEIHHSVPGCRMRGFSEPEQAYELEHFTTHGWGTHYQIDMNEEPGQVVTFIRFNRRGTKMMVAVGHTLGCEFRPVYCSPAVYYDVEGGVREFRQALANNGYGHHQAIIYGNHVKDLQELGRAVGFEVEYFH